MLTFGKHQVNVSFCHCSKIIGLNFFYYLFEWKSVKFRMESFEHQCISNLPLKRSSTWFDAVNSEFFFELSQAKNVGSIGNRIFEDNTHKKVALLHEDQHYERQLNNNMKVSSSSVYCENNAIISYTPCQGPKPWNFAQCYGFYGQPACPLAEIIDMEDFM